MLDFSSGRRTLMRNPANDPRRPSSKMWPQPAVVCFCPQAPPWILGPNVPACVRPPGASIAKTTRAPGAHAFARARPDAK